MKSRGKIINLTTLAIMSVLIIGLLSGSKSLAYTQKGFEETKNFLETYPEHADEIMQEIRNGLYSTEQINNLLSEGYLLGYKDELLSNGWATTQGAASTDESVDKTTTQAETNTQPETTSTIDKSQEILFETSYNMYAVTQINLREQASAESKRLAVITCGEVVEVIGQTSNNKWFKIKYNNQTGYVLQKYLTNEKPDTIDVVDDGGNIVATVSADTIAAVGHEFAELNDDAINALIALSADEIPNNCYIDIIIDDDKSNTFDFSKQTIKGEVLNAVWANQEDNCQIAFIDEQNGITWATWMFTPNNKFDNEQVINLGIQFKDNEDGTLLHFYEDDILSSGVGVVLSASNDAKYIYSIENEKYKYLGMIDYDCEIGSILTKMNDFTCDYFIANKYINKSISENKIENQIQTNQKNEMRGINETIIPIIAFLIILISCFIIFKIRRKRK